MADNRGNLRGSASAAGVSVSVQGADDFLRVSKALKRAGATDLRKELNKGMQAAAKPLIPKVKAAADANLPKHGGMNRAYAKKPYRAQTRTGEKTAGVRIVGNKLDPRVDREGRVAHPVFGRKGKAANGGKNTVVQNVPGAKGYFSETLGREGPSVRDELVRTLNQFVERIARGGA